MPGSGVDLVALNFWTVQTKLGRPQEERPDNQSLMTRLFVIFKPGDV